MTLHGDPARPLAPEELEAMMAAAHRPGILLNKTARPDDPGASGCWLGGEPNLPPEIAWPWFEREGKRVVPMHFLAQIDLAVVPRVAGMPDLPATGVLFFFFTPVLASLFGYPPEAARVIYAAADAVPEDGRRMPDFPDFATLPPYENWPEVYIETPTEGYPRWNFDFLDFDAYWAHAVDNDAFWRAATEANADMFDHLMQLTETRRASGDARGSADFAMHHLFGTKQGREPTGAITRLLTIDSDSDLGVAIGDRSGVVYWVPTEDLDQSNFAHAFLLEDT